MTFSGIELPPVAPLLMRSLRSVGYSTQAALADLIDNGVAADARTIAIDFDDSGGAYMAVVDDGRGMDGNMLVAAMRFGSRDPGEDRTGADLGRFGLGLKTDSLSRGGRRKGCKLERSTREGARPPAASYRPTPGGRRGFLGGLRSTGSALCKHSALRAIAREASRPG